MSFSNCAEVMRYHLNHNWAGIGRPLAELFSVQRREQTALAAQRGGDDSFGRNPNEVREGFRVQRADAVSATLGGARVLRGKLAGVATNALKIDPAEVAAIAPVLALKLGESELARLAADNHSSLGALRAIAAQNCAYGRSLKRALDGYVEAVQSVPEKSFAFAQRACNGTNDVGRTQSPDLLKTLISERIADVDAAWARLGDAIDAEAQDDPLRSALDAWAAANR